MARTKFKVQGSKFKIMKLFGTIIFLLIFFSAMIKPVFAQSSYVLPYPSNMPGSISYNIHLIYENISKFWYFGDFGQFGYNLKMSDKYLVEAKTLFEYKQYLLGYNALKKSDKYFIDILPNLIKAKKNGKSILQKKSVLNEASRKHIETLDKMRTDTPDAFNWQPEKSVPTVLNLKQAIDESVRLREENI